MSGWTDTPLSPVGRRQAAALRRRLLGELPASAIYTSPLQRARHTAAALLPTAQGPLRLMDELREIYCGEVDGLPVGEVPQRYPGLWARSREQTDAGFRWPGGESYRELRIRSLAALHAIASDHLGERVLVVTHCGVISQVLGVLHALSAARWEQFRPENTSLTELDWNDTSQRLVSFNDHRHLLEANAGVADAFQFAEACSPDASAAMRHAPPAGVLDELQQ